MSRFLSQNWGSFAVGSRRNDALSALSLNSVFSLPFLPHFNKYPSIALDFPAT